MRLNGEICYEAEGESEDEGTREGEELVVGYALTLKKKKSFLKPKFERLARIVRKQIRRARLDDRFIQRKVGAGIEMSADRLLNAQCGCYVCSKKGILLLAIDPERPLSDQGPFDIILHKLSEKEWCENIEEYRQKHPEVTVLDPPYAIRHLHNRQSMLQDVADLNLTDCHGKVCVPRQLVITEDPFSIPEEVTKVGLRLPLVAKPLVVDGSAKSHELFLAYDPFSLTKLEPPLILQEFVNHGGLLFKVFIVGDAIKVVRRFSLPNVNKYELAESAGVYRFPRVSSATASADDADLDPCIAELPPRPLLERLARELRRRLGLRLFNIDMIREQGARDLFYVIDINCFPGYGKLPDYEHIFTDFLLSLMRSKYEKIMPLDHEQ